MINQQTLRGQWDEVKATLQERWDTLTDDDLPNFNGDVDQLVARIQTKTGESRDAIESVLEGPFSDHKGQFNEAMASAGRTASEMTNRAAETARDTYDQVTETLHDRFEDSQQMIRNQPGKSVATAFGAGMLTGFLLFLVLRPR